MKWTETDKRRWLIEQGYEESLENYELTQDPATSMDEAKRERSENWRLSNKVIYGLMHEVIRVKLFESMPEYFNRIVKLCNTPEEFERIRSQEDKRRVQVELEERRRHELKRVEDEELQKQHELKRVANEKHERARREFERMQEGKHFPLKQEKVRKKRDKKKNRTKIPAKVEYEVYKINKGACRVCGKTVKEDGVKIHIDHIKPVSKGGSNEVENLQLLCERHNLGKGNSDDTDWR